MHALRGGASHVLAVVASQRAQEGDHGIDAHFRKISSVCDPCPGGSEQYMLSRITMRSNLILSEGEKDMISKSI